MPDLLAPAARASGSPPRVGPALSGWPGQLLAGQDLVGNQAVAAGALSTSPRPPTAKPAPGKKPEPMPLRKATAPPAPGADRKDAKGTDERPEKGAKKKEDAAGPRTPGADPKFQALKKDVAAKKRRVASSHPPPAAEAGAAQGAAVPPADDREARGKAAHAEDMAAAQPKQFDKQAFIAAVEKAVKDRAPKNLDEADKFGESGKAEEVKTEVQGKVGAGKDAAAQEIADTTAAAPQPAPDTKQVVPLAVDQVPGKPEAPNPAQAAPDALPKSATDMSDGPRQVTDRMAEAQVTEQQLAMKNSREPGFDKAVRDKKTLEAHSESAPEQLRAGEATELKKVKATAATRGAGAMAAIHTTRVATGRQVATGKQGAKGHDEDKRAQVAALLQKVFDDTKADVEKILSDLDKKVDDQFTTGEKRARDRFTDEHTRGMDEYKDRRYSGWAGKARWVKDLFADLPEEANRIYERARDHYLTAMREVIADVAGTVESELRHAKERIASGRKELKQAVDTLPKDLRAIGKEAAADFEGKFDELADTVDDKGTELVDTLATKYVDAVKAVDAEIAAEKEKNKSLFHKAADAIGGVIDTIKELGRLLGGVLRKAASAVPLILRDPIGFLGRLISGVGGGLKLFMDNAGRHLQQGVLAWLLGTGVAAGLQLPTSFDVLGILVLIAGLLGLSWPNIRDRLARRVNPKAMAAAETGTDAIPIVVEAKKRGVAGLWSDLKSRVGDLKRDLIGKLVSYLLPTIIIAGITWIVSLFNPASAFIRACKMIIDIIRFIVTQGRQIIEFVNTVLDAVIAIARGGTGGVPAMVERALARSIPVLIGALAAILGIGGIAGKVKQIFQALSRPVNRAIDWVIDKITGLLKKLWNKIKPKPAKPKRPKPKRPKDGGRPDRPRRRPRRPRRPDARRPGKRRPDRGPGRRPRERSEADKRRSLNAALRAANRLIGAASATVDGVRRQLPRLKRRYELTSIRLVESGALHVIELAINPRAKSKKGLFPYRMGKATDSVGLTAVGQQVSNLDNAIDPMEQKHPAAFVVTIAAVPGEVARNPRIAARYGDEAWAGSTERRVAHRRTAVVIGINAAEPLDPRASVDRGAAAVGKAVHAVQRPDQLRVAVFGFVWAPGWVHKETKAHASIDTVRAAYNSLESAGEKEAVREDEEKGVKDRKSVPYGLVRGHILKSPYTKRAVEILQEVNRQVHVLSQDADSGVRAPKGRGVLAAYDEVLRTISGDPVMIIGGYDFEDLDWRENGEPRTVQLTKLANRIDRAIRVAIARHAPEVLYPTEPSTLVKVWDEVWPADRRNRVFQALQDRADAAARDRLPYGAGEGEGRRFRNWLRRLFGADFSVAYDPRASVGTDPRLASSRGFAVRAASRRRKRHAIYAVILQSQSMASARTLANEFFLSNPSIGPRERIILQTRVFTHVEAVIRLMADNPGLRVHDPQVQARLNAMTQAVRDYQNRIPQGERSAAANQRLHDTMDVVERMTRDIITTLTASDLRRTWVKLRAQLRKAQHEAKRASAPRRT
ncbi:hypothetical protein EIY87_44120 [Amycolatopsis eburnea]|uniref:Uncharacterized protein n=1 Tax=Amycolatopsis eburnea TaxID=2267691 RepID=A0A427SV14_9PSEU|nr:hypothetical protein EIY87_44120 [Amycolatopsis eburnea]